jgi:beta-galactosidase
MDSTSLKERHPAESVVIPPHTSLRFDLKVENLCQNEIDFRCADPRDASPVLSSNTYTGVLPKQVPDWSNLNVIHRNTLPPRSHYFLYGSEDEAIANKPESARSLLLSGLWGFNLASSPFHGPTNFYKPDFDNTKWPLVKVPGMWSVLSFLYEVAVTHRLDANHNTLDVAHSCLTPHSVLADIGS